MSCWRSFSTNKSSLLINTMSAARASASKASAKPSALASAPSTTYNDCFKSYCSKVSPASNFSTTRRVLATPVDSMITGAFPLIAKLCKISTNSSPLLQQMHSPAIVASSSTRCANVQLSILSDANSFSITRAPANSGCCTKKSTSVVLPAPSAPFTRYNAILSFIISLSYTHILN